MLLTDKEILMSKIRINNPLYIKTVQPPYKSKHTDESTKKPKDDEKKNKPKKR